MLLRFAPTLTSRSPPSPPQLSLQLATSAGDVVFLLALFLLYVSSARGVCGLGGLQQSVSLRDVGCDGGSARGWTLPGADSARTITVCECIAIGMVFGVFMLVGTLKAFCHESPRLCSAFLVRCRAAAAACLDDNWYNHALALPTL